jgi:hypothetical protein
MYVNFCRNQTRNPILALATYNDFIHEWTGLYRRFFGLPGWETGRIRVMIEKIILLALLIVSVWYIYRHMKRVLIGGEDNEGCANCPVQSITLNEKQKN